MKKLLSLLLIICSIGVAYADDKSTVTSLKYVTDELNTRQDKFGANDGKAMTFTNVAGGNLPRDVKASLGTSTTDTGLPTVSAVNTGLENKQDEIGSANTNTVVTYTGTPGTLGQKGIYQDTGTYAAQQNNLIQASTFNAALRNGLENEFVCADRDPVSNQCWLWTIDNATEETLLPDGYTPLEYIESTGTQYIDTGVKANLNTRVVLDFQLSSYNNNGYILGSRTSQNTNAFIIGSNSGKFVNTTFPFAQFDSVGPTSVQQAPNFDLNRHVYELSSDGFYIDGILYTRYSNSTSFSTQENITLFGRYSSGAFAYGIYRLYSFKLYDGNNLIHSFVPAKRTRDNAIGMYDLAAPNPETAFYMNAGGGTFIDGPNASNVMYIPQNQI